MRSLARQEGHRSCPTRRLKKIARRLARSVPAVTVGSGSRDEKRSGAEGRRRRGEQRRGADGGGGEVFGRK